MNAAPDSPDSSGRFRALTQKWWWVAVLAAVLGVVAVVSVVNNRSDAPTASPSTGPSSTGPSSASPSSAPPPSPTPSATPASKTPGRSPKTPAPTDAPKNPTDANAGRPHAEPVTFDAPAKASADVTVAVTKVESITSSAQVPGESSRPALRLTLTATNSADDDATIRSAVVNLYYGKDRAPATSMLKPGSRWFSAKIPANGKATGVYIFNVPKDERDDVELEVDLDTDLKIVTFKGAV